MNRIRIAKLLQSEIPMKDILVKGWVRTRRDSKGFSFLEVNDGSCLKNVQIIADDRLSNYQDVAGL